ncbi:MAG TPA: hypothetical protein VJ326_02240 [Thermoplasmata archaeon]|nr:hypothetical protein [Thermoplasmata archaeon]
MSARFTEQILEQAAQTPVSDEVESDDNLVRLWQDELREASEKMDTYRSDAGLARTFRADVKHTATVLEDRPKRIATRRAAIAYEAWAREELAAFHEIPVTSKDRTFASVPKAHLEILAPELAQEIPKKSALWADWSVWNFKRNRLNRFKALPAEAVQRARGSVRHFERVEVWQAVGMADPWLVGVMREPSGRDRFYLLFDWGLETTLDREILR